MDAFNEVANYWSARCRASLSRVGEKGGEMKECKALLLRSFLKYPWPPLCISVKHTVFVLLSCALCHDTDDQSNMKPRDASYLYSQTQIWGKQIYRNFPREDRKRGFFQDKERKSCNLSLLTANPI